MAFLAWFEKFAAIIVEMIRNTAEWFNNTNWEDAGAEWEGLKK